MTSDQQAGAPGGPGTEDTEGAGATGVTGSGSLSPEQIEERLRAQRVALVIDLKWIDAM